MVRNNFHMDIKDLKEDVVKMIEKVENLVEKSVEALLNKDLELARKVIKLDDDVDEYMYYIEEKAIELIALQQPMAKDLRIIFSVSKIITDLERIGDFCVNISKETIKIGKEEHIKPLVDIPKMKDIILDMLKNLRSSFILEDASLALKVGKEDELIDNLYKDIYSDILTMIHENREYINQGTKLLFVGRYLERIADHITNICEKIIYISKGEIIEIN
ncbi:phosphate signaling complex protein PhoU [Tepidibacter formicigenes]|uniref:Phosphate-specific transport system accessory protein PhoU n=1 Tax=Tepidibacter formicigenes DSM 15518 TaxID=1123349 RepID=A0A1M6LAG9_9FIRM|nr:phosphate signaling complex protein PhoU [Tepidibacter formicigenes]SHJ68201.1 phosphate uptake regulator, PhoU [Tepidibacter formicigenes DSM 15518]